MQRCPICTRDFLDPQERCPVDDARLVARPSKPAPGLGRVLGTYKLIGVLAEGGMGTIYIAAHTRLDRHVAIKVLRPEFAIRKREVARFFEEARTINRLQHPNIVESIDMVEDVLDGAYCVLELLRGPDLAARLAEGPIPVASAIRIATQIAEALAAVHAEGIVHRDLKPENLVLVERDGHGDFVKLIDFGVAQTTMEGPGFTPGSGIDDSVGTGTPFGTAAYMAPEQAAGERVDGRADLYSLGVLLFVMVTGQHPFPSTTDSEYVVRHASDVAPRASKVARGIAIPPALDAVIACCLAKQAERRFASATELVHALHAIDVRVRGGKWKWVATGTVTLGVAAAAVFVVPDLLAPQQAAQAQTQREPAPAPAPSPPAPSPTPPGPPAPKPAAAEVKLTFSSTPPGAKVYRDGETVPLGVTPFSITMPRSDHMLHVKLELAGYQPDLREVSLAGSTEVAATLTAIPVAKPVEHARPPTPESEPRPRTEPEPEPEQPPKPPQREGVIDPFAPPKE